MATAVPMPLNREVPLLLRAQRFTLLPMERPRIAIQTVCWINTKEPLLGSLNTMLPMILHFPLHLIYAWILIRMVL